MSTVKELLKQLGILNIKDALRFKRECCQYRGCHNSYPYGDCNCCDEANGCPACNIEFEFEEDEDGNN